MRSAEDETMTDYDPYEGRTRDQYLRDLAEENGVPLHMVRLAADMLGPDEDFDGLVRPSRTWQTRANSMIDLNSTEDSLARLSIALSDTLNAGFTPVAEAHIQQACAFIALARQSLELADLDQTHALAELQRGGR